MRRWRRKRKKEVVSRWSIVVCEQDGIVRIGFDTRRTTNDQRLGSAMKIDILTIFPDFFRGPLGYGIVRRARDSGVVEIEIHDLRAFTKDKHHTVDDRPFGGGEGMVLKPEPIFECIEGLNIQNRTERLAVGAKQSVVLLSAQGRRFDQGV